MRFLATRKNGFEGWTDADEEQGEEWVGALQRERERVIIDWIAGASKENLVISPHSCMRKYTHTVLTQLLSHIASRCSAPSHQHSPLLSQFLCLALFQWHQMAGVDKRRERVLPAAPVRSFPHRLALSPHHHEHGLDPIAFTTIVLVH